MSAYEIPQCAICFEELLQNLSVTKCGHVYHKRCIEEAIDKNMCCPLCREQQTLHQVKSLKFSIPVRDYNEANEFFKGLSDQ